jgi:hypothetical protein
MTKMLGRLCRRRFTCQCCDWSCTIKIQRVRETRAWRREVDRGEA